MKQTWSIIILCYNEVATVVQVVAECRLVLQTIATDFEIIVVDDGSTDGSTELLKNICTAHVSTVFHTKNKGIGQSLRTGYAAAQYENVCAIPADGQFDANELLVHQNIPANTFIAFYRKENMQYSLSRNALSWLNKTLNRYLLGIVLYDVNWVKVYKNKVLKTLNLEVRSSLVESEICAKMLILNQTASQEISQYLPREAGISKGASPKIVWQAISDIMLLAFIVRRFRKTMYKTTSVFIQPLIL